ncbi:hypothetical protein C8A05DRAFT_39192 [Staphylotrichum tortipilum]|uniref:Uncharacterized protein n=1 Tax=Staphylotrichum tortipilum TaxID=2831512 RepID=A0AAN6MA68_9PEZI|nr:hypothetical protein C8A05DRAFT_39192 [Staphylotrichum longicolle]
MVSLRSLVAGAALFAPVLAAATAQQIADSLASLTRKFQDLQNPAQRISLVNAPLIIIGQGPFPQIIAGLNDITSTGKALTDQFDGTPNLEGAEGDLVFNAFRGFVRVQQAFLNILIGKAGILEKVPLVGDPVANSLRGVEGVDDTISINLINLLISKTQDAQDEANALSESIDLCISKYEGLATGL